MEHPNNELPEGTSPTTAVPTHENDFVRAATPQPYIPPQVRDLSEVVTVLGIPSVWRLRSTAQQLQWGSDQVTQFLSDLPPPIVIPGDEPHPGDVWGELTGLYRSIAHELQLLAQLCDRAFFRRDQKRWLDVVLVPDTNAQADADADAAAAAIDWSRHLHFRQSYIMYKEHKKALENLYQNFDARGWNSLRYVCVSSG